MRLVVAWLLVGVTAGLAVMGAVLKKAADVAIEKEYATWAPKLARLLVRAGGFVCRSRRDQWWSDLCYAQQSEQSTGLVEALSCFFSSWYVALGDAFRAALTRGVTATPVLLVMAAGVASVVAVVVSGARVESVVVAGASVEWVVVAGASVESVVVVVAAAVVAAATVVVVAVTVVAGGQGRRRLRVWRRWK